MVGRLAGRLVISGGRITTGTTPEAMEEEVACGGMRGACGQHEGNMWGTCGIHVGNVGYMCGTCGVHVGNVGNVGDRDANSESVAAIHSPT